MSALEGVDCNSKTLEVLLSVMRHSLTPSTSLSLFTALEDTYIQILTEVGKTLPVISKLTIIRNLVQDDVTIFFDQRASQVRQGTVAK